MLSSGLKQQVRKIAAAVAVMGALQLLAFFVLSRLRSVPFGAAFLGTLTGCALAVLNFFLLAKSIDKAVDGRSVRAGSLMALGYALRLILTAAVVFAAIKLPELFNLWAVVLPLIFPRIAIMLINLRKRRE